MLKWIRKLFSIGEKTDTYEPDEIVYPDPYAVVKIPCSYKTAKFSLADLKRHKMGAKHITNIKGEDFLICYNFMWHSNPEAQSYYLKLTGRVHIVWMGHIKQALMQFYALADGEDLRVVVAKSHMKHTGIWEGFKIPIHEVSSTDPNSRIYIYAYGEWTQIAVISFYEYIDEFQIELKAIAKPNSSSKPIQFIDIIQ